MTEGTSNSNEGNISPSGNKGNKSPSSSDDSHGLDAEASGPSSPHATGSSLLSTEISGANLDTPITPATPSIQDGNMVGRGGNLPGSYGFQSAQGDQSPSTHSHAVNSGSIAGGEAGRDDSTLDLTFDSTPATPSPQYHHIPHAVGSQPEQGDPSPSPHSAVNSDSIVEREAGKGDDKVGKKGGGWWCCP